VSSFCKVLLSRIAYLRCRMLAWAILILPAVNIVPAFADVDSLHFSGFGTLAYARNNQKNISPLRDVTQSVVSVTSIDSWVLDSRLGMQLEYNISTSADFVGQVVLRDKFHANFNNSTELAYVAIRPHSNLDLRLGRISYDAFLMSEYRDVSFVQPWVRPPSEFYGWLPIFSVNGADGAYSFQSDEASWRIKAQAGSSKASIPIGAGYDLRADNLFGVSITRQSDSLRLKAAYSQWRTGSEPSAFTPLHQGLDAVATAAIPGVSAEAADLRRNLSFKDSKISYLTVGAAFDDGVWLAQGELGLSTSTAAVVPHGIVAYVSVGHNFGDWMPYLMLSSSLPSNDLRSATNDWGTVSANGLRDSALFTVNATRIEQETASIGTRFQLHPKATFKLQWDNTTIKPSGYGLWWRSIAINNQITRVNLISTSLDFIF